MSWNEFKGEEFVGETIDICGKTHIGCDFQRCVIEFSADSSEPTTVAGSHFENCRFVLRGAAARTASYLSALYATGPAGRQIVEEFFADIRSGEFISGRDGDEDDDDDDEAPDWRL